MDVANDLMVFSDPSIKQILPEPLEEQSLSPGSNPFDTLLKVANEPSYKQSTSKSNILDVAFVDGITFQLTETSLPEIRNSLAPNSYESDYNRELLNILHIDCNEHNDDVFLKDTLIVPSPYKSSYRSFLKSINIRSSQSTSLPSTIYSIQTSFQNSYTDSLLVNFAMSSNMIEKHLQFTDAVIASPRKANSVSCFEECNLKKSRRRISSGPSVLYKNETDWDNELKESSLSRVSKDKSEENENNSMDDLVFNEISHTAVKIINDFILEKNSDNILDTTPAPKFEEIFDEVPEKIDNCHTETVFKMLPTKSEINNKTSLNVSDNLKTNCGHYSAKDAIQSLAEILKSKNLNEKCKIEGQNLLKCLAEILCVDDSDRSFTDIEHEVQDKDDCYENLNLHGDNNTGSEQTETLNLSVNTKTKLTPKSSICQRRGSISFKQTNKTPTSNSKIIKRASESLLQSANREFTKNQADLSNGSDASVLNEPTFSKLKFRKSGITKNGPVKAIINLANKISSPKVAPQTDKYKKTSTPVNKSKIKPIPIAQSTPEECKTNDVVGKRIKYPLSPLLRPEYRQDKIECDSNLVNNDFERKLARSNSTSNVKKKTTSKLMSMHRSFSSSKGIALKKPTETEKLKNSTHKILIGNMSNPSLKSRSFSLLAKLKKGPEKENIPY